MTAPFRPAWWCRGPHLQTIWPKFRLLRRPLPLLRERIELPDGDFLDLDWAPGGGVPIVLILHGLEGSSRSPYAQGLLRKIQARGWRGAVMHFRGCSGEPNRLARSYHSGETGDLAFVVDLLRRRAPHAPLAAVGVSLGGNVLLKWLGESGPRARLDAAVAVSVPFVLQDAADRMARGFSRLYQRRMLQELRRSIGRKFRQRPCPIALQDLNRWRSFWEFDEHVTAPLHGFTGAHHYYTVASSRQYLKGITVPTLVLHAADDPFMRPETIPGRDELSPSTTLEVQPQGGHVGFVAGPWPWRAHYWLEERIPDYLQEIFWSSRTGTDGDRQQK